MKKIIIAVVCAMFGVRSSRGLEEDKNLSIGALLITGFLATIFFILSLVLFIKFIVLA